VPPLSSETTAAAVGQVGVVRGDPMAMLPFIGYDAADYLRHWLTIGKHTHHPDRLPKIFQVNWFRRGADGRLLWPGYGENSRILKWIVERLDGTADALDTPIGQLPDPAAIDTEGLHVPDADLAAALHVDTAEWAAELPQITAWFHRFGDRLPATLWTELDTLHHRLTNQ
jgi:phosphoenolpyruvate carboxykinase (GTP)